MLQKQALVGRLGNLTPTIKMERASWRLVWALFSLGIEPKTFSTSRRRDNRYTMKTDYSTPT